MRFVLTVIAAPEGAPLELPLAEALAGALGQIGAAVAGPDWLAPGRACDLAFSGLEMAAAKAVVAPLLAAQPFDWAVQPRAGRRKAVLVADMESTIIGQEMLDELAEGTGLREQVSAITARAMAGELDFAEALDARVGLLRDLPLEVLEQVGARMTLNPGARRLVQSLRRQGVHTALVTGGFDCFAEPIAEACGFHELVANRLVVADGRLTGQVTRPLVDRRAKLTTMERLVAARGLTASAACAVGDGANDAEMLAAAGLGVAYRGKPPAKQAANAALDHADLSAILYLQGYRAADLVD